MATLDIIVKSLKIRTDQDTHPQPQVYESLGDIAYVHDGDVWLLSTATRESRRLTIDGQVGELLYINGTQSLTWTPDGTSLIFATKRHGNFDLYQIDVDDPSSTETRLTNDPREEAAPVVASDGTLFFSRYNPTHDPNSPRLAYNQMIVQRDTSGEEQIIAGSETDISSMYFFPRHLSLSPDERQLAITYAAGASVYQTTNILDLETGDMGDLRYSQKNLDQATWATTQHRMVVQDKGISEIIIPENLEQSVYILDFTSTPPDLIPLFSREGHVTFLDWSPDDQWIVFSQRLSTDGGKWSDGLWIVSAEGGQPIQISRVGYNPVWRPKQR